MTTSFKELFAAIILTVLVFILGILNAGAQTTEFPPVFIGDLFGYTLDDVNETSTTSQRRYEAKVKPSPWYGCTELYTFDRPDSVVLRFIAPSNTGLPYIDQFLGSYKKNADGTWMLSGRRTGSAKVLSSPVFAFLVDSLGNVLASSTVSDAIYSTPEYVTIHDTVIVKDTIEVIVNDTIEVPRELSKRERYDVNGDGKINATDIVNIYNYIIHASAIQSKSFNLDDMLIGISGIGLPVDEQENVYYDVMGNKVLIPTRGCIYIYNGQKVRF